MKNKPKHIEKKVILIDSKLSFGNVKILKIMKDFFNIVVVLLRGKLVANKRTKDSPMKEVTALIAGAIDKA